MLNVKQLCCKLILHKYNKTFIYDNYLYLLSYIYELIHIIGVFFIDFTLRITLQCINESATEAFPWTGKNSSRISTNKLREFVRKKNSKWICYI